MKKFIKLMKEVNVTIDEVMVFEALLESLLVFLFFSLLLSLISVNILYSLIPSIAYLIVTLYLRLSEDKAWIVEKRWDILNEKLRTAEDNISKEGPVVEALQEEITKDIRQVKVSSFFRMRSTTLKIFGAVILSFLILLLAANDLTLIDIKDVVKLPGFKILVDSEGSGEGGSAPGGDRTNDLFGEESIAQLGTEEIKVEINVGGFEITGMRNEEPPKRDFEESFPDEFGLVECDKPPCLLENDIPVDQQELVKNYFVKLSGG